VLGCALLLCALSFRLSRYCAADGLACLLERRAGPGCTSCLSRRDDAVVVVILDAELAIQVVTRLPLAHSSGVSQTRDLAEALVVLQTHEHELRTDN